MKNQYNTRIKLLRTDNGKEFTKSKFKEFCTNSDINHQFTIPYNPLQNDKIERLNQTLIYSPKAMLHDSLLNHQFWEDAINTSNYIYNHLLHRGIKNGIPFEILNKSKVNYSNIRVFGCKVFFFIPRAFRSKFDNNADPGIYIRYSENPSGYKNF